LDPFKTAAGDSSGRTQIPKKLIVENFCAPQPNFGAPQPTEILKKYVF